MTTPELRDMPIEVEKRAFAVDADVMRQRLLELGAHSQGILEYRRAVLDVIPAQPDTWIRVRTDGTKTELAVKQRFAQTATGTGEVEVFTSGFYETLDVLRALNGYVPRSIQENRREQFAFDGVEVSIDTWPRIGTVVELEAKDEFQIDAVAEKLGILATDLSGLSIEQYYLDTLGIDVKTIPELLFSENE